MTFARTGGRVIPWMKESIRTRMSFLRTHQGEMVQMPMRINVFLTMQVATRFVVTIARSHNQYPIIVVVGPKNGAFFMKAKPEA